MYYLRKRDHNNLFTTIPIQLQLHICNTYSAQWNVTVRKYAEPNLAEGL